MRVLIYSGIEASQPGKQDASDVLCCPVQELRAQFQAMVDDTTQQQASLVKRLKEQHAAERNRMQR